jgi:hypothetical protein
LGVWGAVGLCSAGLLLIASTFLPWFHDWVQTSSRAAAISPGFSIGRAVDRGYSGWDLFADCGSWPGQPNEFPATCTFYAPADDALLPREMITGAWTLVAGSALVAVGSLIGVRSWRQRPMLTWVTVCAWLASLLAGVVVAALWAIEQSYLLLSEGGTGGSKSQLQAGTVLVSLAPIVAVVSAVLVTIDRLGQHRQQNPFPSTSETNLVPNDIGS